MNVKPIHPRRSTAGKRAASAAARGVIVAISLLLAGTQCSQPDSDHTEESARQYHDPDNRDDSPSPSPMAISAIIAILADLTTIDQLENLQPDDAAAHFMITCYWLFKASGTASTPIDPLNAIDALERARIQNGSENSTLAQETAGALARGLDTLQDLGCLDASGQEQLKNGEAPTIRKGADAGSAIAVGHIIPPSRARDLENKIFNLEFRAGSAGHGAPAERQLEFARRWHWQGLLSNQDYATIVYAFPSHGAGR